MQTEKQILLKLRTLSLNGHLQQDGRHSLTNTKMSITDGAKTWCGSSRESTSTYNLSSNRQREILV